jgi:hypothetical protein
LAAKAAGFAAHQLEGLSVSVSKQLASYQESGHAIRAYFENKNSISAGTITLQSVGNGHWNGGTGVDLTLIPEERHVDIALAGLMAEARFNGIQHPATGGNAHLPNEQPDLAVILHDYFNLDQADIANQQLIESTPVQVLRPNGQPVTVLAAISFDDLNLIPDADRVVGQVSAAITRLSAFFNDAEHWLPTGLLADDLNETHWPHHYDYLALLQATGLPQ